MSKVFKKFPNKILVLKKTFNKTYITVLDHLLGVEKHLSVFFFRTVFTKKFIFKRYALILAVQTKIKWYQQSESLRKYMELWEKKCKSYPLSYIRLKNWGHTSWQVRTTFDFEVHKSTKVYFDRRHPLFALSYVLKLFFYKNCLLS